MNNWIKLVNKKMKLGKNKNKKYSLRDAIKEAKKEYKPTNSKTKKDKNKINKTKKDKNDRTKNNRKQKQI